MIDDYTNKSIYNLYKFLHAALALGVTYMGICLYFLGIEDFISLRIGMIIYAWIMFFMQFKNTTDNNNIIRIINIISIYLYTVYSLIGIYVMTLVAIRSDFVLSLVVPLVISIVGHWVLTTCASIGFRSFNQLCCYLIINGISLCYVIIYMSIKYLDNLFICVIPLIILMQIVFGFNLYIRKEIDKYVNRLNSRLSELAYYDELTGLYNRRGIIDALNVFISRAKRDGGSVCIIMIDLDKFKSVNDSLGHEQGDDLLYRVARRLRTTFRIQDSVGRLGGDEFIILCDGPNVEKHSHALAKKALSIFDKPFKGFEKFEVKGSIGLSYYPRDGKNPKILLKKADIGMYIAKETHLTYHEFVTSDKYEHGRMEW